MKLKTESSISGLLCLAFVGAIASFPQTLALASTIPKPLLQLSDSALEQAQEPNPLFLVQQNGLYGYMASTGKLVIEPKFDVASSFYQGLAVVVINNKFGYIDSLGKLIVQPQFDWAYRFSEGRAEVGIGGKAT